MFDVRCDVLTVMLLEKSDLAVYVTLNPRRLESSCIVCVLKVNNIWHLTSSLLNKQLR